MPASSEGVVVRRDRAKRLEKGRFAALWERAELTSSELTLFLEGSTAVGRIELSPLAFDFERDGRAKFSK